MGPGALGGTEDGAQIVGIGDLVADHQQRRFAPVGGGLQNALHRHILPDGGQRDNALMGVGARHGVQLAAVGLHHHNARGAGLGGDVAQRLVRLALGKIDLVDGRSGPQRLDHRVASLDHAVGLRLRHRAALRRGRLLFHRNNSFPDISIQY